MFVYLGMCACVCMCVYLCVCVCMCVYLCVCVCVWNSMFLAMPATLFNSTMCLRHRARPGLGQPGDFTHKKKTLPFCSLLSQTAFSFWVPSPFLSSSSSSSLSLL